MLDFAQQGELAALAGMASRFKEDFERTGFAAQKNNSLRQWKEGLVHGTQLLKQQIAVALLDEATAASATVKKKETAEAE